MPINIPSLWYMSWYDVFSSSNFPRFDRNMNTGGNNYDETEGVVAHNAVHHSTQYPSRITLNVVRR